MITAKLMVELMLAGARWMLLATAALVVGILAISQITVLNIGVGRHSSLVLVPMFVATFVATNAVGGKLCTVRACCYVTDFRQSPLSLMVW